jgi:hypothetical protein
VSIPEEITNHEGEAVALLTDAHRNTVVTRGIVEVLSRRAQAFETVLWQVLDGFNLDTCVGVQLDTLGAIVKEKRNGRGDANYRNMIKIRIKVLRSRGRAVDVLEVARLLDPAALYHDLGQLGWEVEIYDTDFGGDYVKALADTRCVTSSGVLLTSDWTGELAEWDYL